MKAIKWTISIFIILLSFIVTLVTIQSITAHDGNSLNPLNWFKDHAVDNPFFESTTPEVSCNIDSHKFTYVKNIYCDGVKGRTYWYSPDLVKDPIVKMTATLHGTGWLRTNFCGYIDDEFKGNHNFTTAVKKGSTIAAFVPYRGAVHDEEIELEFTGNLKKETKTYQWKAKGTVELTPVYWQRKWGLNIGSSSGGVALTGEWKKGNIQDYTPLPIEEPHDGYVEGAWEVKVKEEQLDIDKNGNPCGGSSSGGSSNNNYSNGNNNGNDSEGTESGQVTAPDRPGRFTLTPYKYSILLRWEPSDSDGGSPIERYEYQYQSGNYNRRAWSSWSEWTSAGKRRSTWITGLSPGVNYGVRMRAYNGEEYSRKTGIVIVRTKK